MHIKNVSKYKKTIIKKNVTNEREKKMIAFINLDKRNQLKQVDDNIFIYYHSIDINI